MALVQVTRRMFLKLSAALVGAGGLVAINGIGCGDAEVDDCPEGTSRHDLPDGYGYGYYFGYGSGGEPYICR